MINIFGNCYIGIFFKIVIRICLLPRIWFVTDSKIVSQELHSKCGDSCKLSVFINFLPEVSYLISQKPEYIFL